MPEEQTPPAGPDHARGVAPNDFTGETLLGHVGDQDVLLVRLGSEVFAIDAHCSHYHGPLAEGLVVGDCPWHHACFDLRTGEATRAPALTPLAVWQVEHEGDRIFVRQKRVQPKPRGKGPVNMPGKIVIVGGGAAGFAAAEMLRRQEFGGSIVMLSSDAAPPVDRPNLSKDYLAGSAPEDWLPLRSDSFYADAGIDLRLKTDVFSIDTKARNVIITDGDAIAYDRLLLATGAEPVRLPIPGADQPHVHILRSLADCRAIIESAKGARRAIVIGASFIGLEAAAALRARDIEVHVVAPEQRPMERVLGPEMGDFVRALHEEHRVIFQAQGGLGVGDDPGDGLVDFVGDRSRQLADSCDARDVSEFRLCVAQLPFRPPGRGDIHDRPHELDPARFIISHGASHDVHGLGRAVRHQELVFELPILSVA